MGFKARASAATSTGDSVIRELRANVASLQAELDKEWQQTRDLEVELSECTDKYQELTRKSMDFEEQLGDVEQDRDDALALAETLQARLDAAEGPTAAGATPVELAPGPSISSRLPLPAAADEAEDNAIDTGPGSLATGDRPDSGRVGDE